MNSSAKVLRQKSPITGEEPTKAGWNQREVSKKMTVTEPGWEASSGLSRQAFPGILPPYPGHKAKPSENPSREVT